MKKLEVYDPAMCCSTGVCGPDVDTALVAFAANLKWLATEGAEVVRYNLGQQPQAFVENTLVKKELETSGTGCLPLILVDDRIVSKGVYPSRDELILFAGPSKRGCSPSIYTDAIAELVAIGAAIAANCEPCFKYHYQQATKLGVSREDMMRAVKTAQSVKEAPAKAVFQLAQRFLEGDPEGLPKVKSCCG